MGKKVKFADCVYPITAFRIKLLYTVGGPFTLNEPVNPVQSIVPTLMSKPLTVTVPDAAVKNAVDPIPGTEAPPAPPSVSDHFRPAVLSQMPVPPTQYLTGGNTIPVLLPKFVTPTGADQGEAAPVNAMSFQLVLVSVPAVPSDMVR